jgi:hypothetical protein
MENLYKDQIIRIKFTDDIALDEIVVLKSNLYVQLMFGKTDFQRSDNFTIIFTYKDLEQGAVIERSIDVIKNDIINNLGRLAEFFIALDSNLPGYTTEMKDSLLSNVFNKKSIVNIFEGQKFNNNFFDFVSRFMDRDVDIVNARLSGFLV